MEGAWCIGCKASVSSFHAAHKLPCSACGGTDYVIIQRFRQDPITECDAKAEQLMRTGLWDDARQEYLACSQFEASEINLRMATLEWRQECAGYVLELLNEVSEPMQLEKFKKQLLANYDEYVTQWILRDFLGIRLIPDESSYLVALNDTLSEV